MSFGAPLFAEVAQAPAVSVSGAAAWVSNGAAWVATPDGEPRQIALPKGASGPRDLSFGADGLWLVVDTPDGARAAMVEDLRAEIPRGLRDREVRGVAAGAGLPGVVLETDGGLRWWSGEDLQPVTIGDDAGAVVHPNVPLVAFLRGGVAYAVMLTVRGGYQRGSQAPYFHGRADCTALDWGNQSLLAICGGAAWSGTREGRAYLLAVGPSTLAGDRSDRVAIWTADGISLTSWDARPLGHVDAPVDTGALAFEAGRMVVTGEDPPGVWVFETP